MANKLMYIPNDNTQNYTFCRLQKVVETFGYSSFKPTNQNSVKVPKVPKWIWIRKPYYKKFRTSIFCFWAELIFPTPLVDFQRPKWESVQGHWNREIRLFNPFPPTVFYFNTQSFILERRRRFLCWRSGKFFYINISRSRGLRHCRFIHPLRWYTK